MDELEGLRGRIDAVDARLVELLAARRDLVAQVAELKGARGLPLYHPAREEDLISRRREQGRRAGLDPDLVEDVFRRLLRSSRVAQSRSLAVRGVRPGAVVLLVGGGGSMGRGLHGWFRTAGYEVRVLEREDWDRVAELAAGADLAVLAVPIDATADAAARLGPHLPPECVLADITSVKAAPLDAMLRAHPGPVVGLHPMFGPTTATMDQQIVVVTPGRDEPACRWVLDQLAAWGAVLVEATAEEHDEVMGVVQALRHFATFAFGQFLCRQGVPLARTLEFSSPIYRLELGMVGRLFAQDPALYAEILFATPERRELLRGYLESVAQNLAMVEAGDKEGFCAEFRRVASWFGPFGDQAMRESSYLIEKLVERF
ncbi:MAG: bifunctional chorismate mutase/prephenate dehydrogenase [Deferrisomatales bacterium]|nr:bifunctional chorismate mutase/prephenate dehydrogenase [Deferrisomatales bacterium]